MKTQAWIGLDVHKNSVTVALVESGAEGEKFTQKMPNSPHQLVQLMRKLQREYDLRVCYEAGPCGYSLYRKFAAAGIPCTVVAPSLIPVDLKKVKTDRLDAVKLAKYHRSGLLTAVNVPDARLENDRDLVRLRFSQVKELTRIKQQILAFLLRKGMESPAHTGWSGRFENWLATVDLGDAQERALLHRYLNHYNYQKRFILELTGEIGELAGSERYAPMVAILRGFRGIETVTAMTILTHLADFRAFPGPRKLMSYIGLTPGEYSSGDSRKNRGITKTGNNLLRRAFVSIGQHYSTADKVSAQLRLRRDQLSAPILAVVQRADRRCRKRYFALRAKGKHNNTVKTAVAREVIAFVWEAMMHHYGGQMRAVV